MANIPECPPSFKPIQHYLKTALEHDSRDPVVAYWCRLYALQVGLKITQKAPEETNVLLATMDWLEQAKKTHKDNEAVTNEVAAQAHLENYALKLFMYADKQDREANFGKNVVKAFYTAGMVYDVLTTFGELTEEAAQNRKYAKWKAAYIHNCLKSGETPVPGPAQNEDDDFTEAGPANPSHDTLVTPASPSDPALSAGDPAPSTGDPAPPTGDPAPPTGFGAALPDPAAALRAASQLPPVPYTPDPSPGGFVPYEPPPSAGLYDVSSTSVAHLNPAQIAKAQKYCKWASSALNYDDVKTAIANLTWALQLLQTGRDPA